MSQDHLKEDTSSAADAHRPGPWQNSEDEIGDVLVGASETDLVADEMLEGEDDEIRDALVRASDTDLVANDISEGTLERTTSTKSAVGLSRCMTTRSTASSWKDPGPPPDGGLLAWTQVAMVHLTVFSTWGYISSFGVFQTYYETTLRASPSAISWLGSVQIFLLFFVGTISGRALDAGWFHHVYLVGSIMQLLGIFTTSAATKYWQLFLSQGLCVGFANGLHFTPAMSLLTTYFAKKRSLALGLGALGSCTGGIIFPVIVQQMLPKVGFPWTIRTIGFVMLVTNIITLTFYRTRLLPRKSGPLVEWAAFKEAPYSLLCAAMFFNFWGLYFAFFFIGSYGRNILGLSYQDSINLLITIVSTGFVFRIVPNYIADRVGPLNSIIPFSFLASLMVYLWICIKSRPSLFVFATFYGISSAGIQSLYPPTLSSLTEDLGKAGVRMGMGFSIVAFASLTGPPLAGALIQINGGNYLFAQIWGGTSFFIGGSLLIATRFSKVGWHLDRRI